MMHEKAKQILPGAIVGIILTLHCLRCLFLFDPIQGIFSSDPITVGDYPVQFWAGILGREHTQNAHRLWGYDTQFMAGWLDPAGFGSDFPIKILFAKLQDRVNPAILSRLAVLLSTAIGPCFFAVGAHLLGLKGWRLASAVFLATLYWWIALPYRMIKWGMFLYVACAYCVLLAHGLLATCLRRPSVATCVLSGTSIAFTAFVHPAGFICLGIPCLALLLLYLRTRWRWMVLLGLSALPGLLILGYNMFYLSWMFLDRGYVLSTNFNLNFGRPFRVLGPILDLVYYRDLVNAPEEAGRAALEASLYLLSVIGFVSFRKPRAWTPEKLSVLATAVGAFFLTFYGPLLPVLKDLQVYRFKVVLFLYLCLAAGPACIALARELVSMRRFRSLAWSAPCMMGIGLASWHAVGILQTWRPIGRMPQGAKDLVSWIGQNTDDSARVLLEESGPFDREGTGTLKYFDGYLPAVIPYLTGREVAGGLHPYLGGLLPGPCYILPANHASFADGYLFRRDVSEVSRPYFRQMIELYNIKWIVSWSGRSHRFLLAHSDFVKSLGVVGWFEVFEVAREGSFFLKGKGQCQAEVDVIRLSQIEPEDGEVILSYHWFDVLETEPHCEMDGVRRPLDLVDDPLPFIRIKNPPAALVIRTRGCDASGAFPGTHEK